MDGRVLLVAALALTAGCGSLVAGDETPTAGETVTPAPVPTVTETPERWGIAPGLAGGGVADVDALVRAHLAATANRSYVWREYRGFGSADAETVRTSTVTVARVESSSVYTLRTGRWQVRIEGELSNVANYSEYADGTVRRARYRLLGRSEPTARALPPTSARSHPYVGGAATTAIRRYLDVDNATVSEILVDGDRHYRVVSHPEAVRVPGETRNATVTAVVSPDGFVRSLEVSYLATSAGTPRRVTYGFAYELVDETNVDPPDWYEASD